MRYNKKQLLPASVAVALVVVAASVIVVAAAVAGYVSIKLTLKECF